MGLTALRHVTDRVRAYGCVVAAAALLSSGLACADAPLQPIATRLMPTSTGPRTNVTTVVNSRAATVYSAPADFDVATTGVALTTVDFSVDGSGQPITDEVNMTLSVGGATFSNGFTYPWAGGFYVGWPNSPVRVDLPATATAVSMRFAGGFYGGGGPFLVTLADGSQFSVPVSDAYIGIVAGSAIGSLTYQQSGDYPMLNEISFGGAPPGYVAAGSNVAVTPVDPATGTTPVTLTFATVTAPGTTTVTTSSTGAPPPLAFKMGTPPVYYELQTTATFTGAITVCFGYTPGAFGNPGNLRLFHGGAGGGWSDVTTTNVVDGTASKICGSVTSLSPFILAELHYDFVGFFQPVDNPGPNYNVVNTVKAGAAVPVKFSLGGNMGLNVFQSGAPYSSGRPCINGMESAVEETVTAGASGLTYDAASGQYTYVWKTDKAWAGMCRTLTVAFKDGTVQGALFRLTK